MKWLFSDLDITILQVCMQKIFHSKNCEIIIDILIRNEYPLDFINQQINKRFSKIFYIKKDVNINNNINSQFCKILCIPNSLNPSKLL